MSHSTKHAFRRFLQTTEQSRRHFETLNAEKAKMDPWTVKTMAGSLTNRVWQDWNEFWRTYWLVVTFGGDGYKGRLSPQCRSQGASRDIHLLASRAYSMRFRRRSGQLLRHEEPTWGDLKCISQISSVLSPRVASVMTAYAATVSDIQVVRNALIHVHGPWVGLSKVMLRYSVSGGIHHPSEVLFSRDIATGRVAFPLWIEFMRAALLLA